MTNGGGRRFVASSVNADFWTIVICGEHTEERAKGVAADSQHHPGRGQAGTFCCAAGSPRSALHQDRRQALRKDEVHASEMAKSSTT